MYIGLLHAFNYHDLGIGYFNFLTEMFDTCVKVLGFTLSPSWFTLSCFLLHDGSTLYISKDTTSTVFFHE
jgi:hypothetical protein